MEVGVHEAKTRLSELLRGVEAGNEVVVTRAGEPIARIVPVAPRAQPPSLFGLLADDFGDPGDWEYDDAEAERMGDLFGVGEVEPG